MKASMRRQRVQANTGKSNPASPEPSSPAPINSGTSSASMGPRFTHSFANVSVFPPGQPLGEQVRGPMEQAFGADFADVRVHESARPAQVGAWAYTLNDDIHFQPGMYQPHTTEGQALLGHELTHVIQQRQAGFNTSTALNRDAGLETEADTAGTRAARGEAVTVTGSASGVQAKGPDDLKSLYTDVIEVDDELEDGQSESEDEEDSLEVAEAQDNEELKGQYVTELDLERQSEDEEPENAEPEVPVNTAFARRFDQFFAERNARMNGRREEESVEETKEGYESDVIPVHHNASTSLASSAEIVNEGKQEVSDSEGEGSSEAFGDFFAQRRKRMAQAASTANDQTAAKSPYSDVVEAVEVNSSSPGRERSNSDTVYSDFIPSAPAVSSEQPKLSKKAKKIHKAVAKGVKKLEGSDAALPGKENGEYTNTKKNAFGDTQKTDFRGNTYFEPGERDSFQIMFKEGSGVKERTKYLSEEERAKFEVSVDNQGLLHQQAYANSGSDVMDTTNAAAPTFAGSSSGRFIVVMDQSGHIYAMDSQREMFQPEAILKQEDLETVKKALVAKLRQQAQERQTDSSVAQPKLERIHHSTAIAGEDASAAGEIEIKNGRIVAISDVSGHYKPTPEMMFQLTQELTSRNPDALRDTSLDADGNPVNKPAQIELIGKHLDHGVKKETALAKGITLTSDQFAQTYGNETGIRLKKDLNQEIESKHVADAYDEQKMADIEARLEERRKAQRDLSAEEFSQMSDQLQGMGASLEEAVEEPVTNSSNQASSPDASGYDPVPPNLGALDPANLGTTGYDSVPISEERKRGYGLEIPVSDPGKGYGVPMPVSDEAPKSGYGVPIPVGDDKPSTGGYGVPLPTSSNGGYVGEEFSAPSSNLQQGRARGYGISFPVPNQPAPIAQQPAQSRGNIITRAINWIKRKLGF